MRHLLFDEIEDLTCKEKIRGYSQYVNRLMNVLLLLFLGVNILCWMVFENDLLSLGLAMVSIILYRFLFTLKINAYIHHMAQDLLYKRCDPYRMTLIMDHLLDHHKIETMFGEYILMTSLREQDNHERIKRFDKSIKNNVFKSCELTSSLSLCKYE